LAPPVVMIQPYILAVKSDPPLVCQVKTLGEIIGVRVQEDVPEKLHVTAEPLSTVAVLDTTISRSPTLAEAANVQEADAADAFPTQLAEV
jgi:hypothetical protein